VKATEPIPGMFHFYVVAANSGISRNMISTLAQFEVLRELKIVLDEKVYPSLPRLSQESEVRDSERLMPICFCCRWSRCEYCCSMIPGLEKVDAWTWRVKGEEPAGPVIKFVCSGKLEINCVDEGNP